MRMEAWPVGGLSSGTMRWTRKDMNEKITLDNGWPSHGRLLKSAPPSAFRWPGLRFSAAPQRPLLLLHHLVDPDVG